jgi:hypothetical protein
MFLDDHHQRVLTGFSRAFTLERNHFFSHNDNGAAAPASEIYVFYNLSTVSSEGHCFVSHQVPRISRTQWNLTSIGHATTVAPSYSSEAEFSVGGMYANTMTLRYRTTCRSLEPWQSSANEYVILSASPTNSILRLLYLARLFGK